MDVVADAGAVDSLVIAAVDLDEVYKNFFLFVADENKLERFVHC